MAFHWFARLPTMFSLPIRLWDASMTAPGGWRTIPRSLTCWRASRKLRTALTASSCWARRSSTSSKRRWATTAPTWLCSSSMSSHTCAPLLRHRTSGAPHIASWLLVACCIRCMLHWLRVAFVACCISLSLQPPLVAQPPAPSCAGAREARMAARMPCGSPLSRNGGRCLTRCGGRMAGQGHGGVAHRRGAPRRHPRRWLGFWR